MSTRTAFTVVGAAIGAYFGNAALGATIGGLVGGWVDPVQSFGPRMTDAQRQTAEDGVPIPIVFGVSRLMGNIIASADLREHKKTDDGKSGQESITYTYTRTYAISICEGPIAGIRKIWRNSKLIFDVSERPDYITAYLTSAKFRRNTHLYFGDEEQEPDSELQAIFGIANVSAHRGLAYMVKVDDDLTDTAGAIPTYEFEVVTHGSTISTPDYYPATFVGGQPFSSNRLTSIDPRVDNGLYRYRCIRDSSGNIPEWCDDLFTAVNQAEDVTGYPNLYQGEPDVRGWAEYNQPGYIVGYGASSFLLRPWLTDLSESNPASTLRVLAVSRRNAGQYVAVRAIGSGPESYAQCSTFADPIWSATYSSDDPDNPPPYDNWNQLPSGVLYYQSPDEGNDRSFTCNIGSTGHDMEFYGDFIIAVQAMVGCNVTIESTWLENPDVPGTYVDVSGQVHLGGECEVVEGSFLQLQKLVLGTSETVNVVKPPLGPTLISDDSRNTEEFWTTAYESAVLSGDMEAGLEYGVDYPVSVTQACHCDPIQVIRPDSVLLSDIVTALAIRPGMLNVNLDVSELTDEVQGFLVATDSTAADIINTLAPAYQFDSVEFDDKVHFIKRGHDHVGEFTLDDSVEVTGPRLTETRAQDVEVPQRLVLTYFDPSTNYAATTQRAERRRVTVKATGTDTIQIPAVFDADKAAQIADIVLKDKWSALRGTLKQTLSDQFSIYTPTDVIYVGSEGAVFRARLGPITVQNGTMEYEALQDLQSAYTSDVEGTPALPPTDVMESIIGPTLAYYLNLPALRDKDDQPGFYVAACGFFGGWRGAQIDISTDGGFTWKPGVSIKDASTMGYLMTPLGEWTEDILQDAFVDVFLTQGDVESITRAQLYDQGNGAVIDGEIIQFETATLIEEKVYRLSGLVRGRKNTQVVAHEIDAPFCLLESVYFLPVDRGLIGSVLQVRASSAGTATSLGEVGQVVLSPDNSVTEWPVTHIRAVRDDGTHDLVLSWSPRARLGNARTPYQSQWFTGYSLVFSDGAISRAYASLSSEFTYTAAMQIADFGSTPSPLSFTIAATNSITGAGASRGGSVS